MSVKLESELKKLLIDFSDVFAKDQYDAGLTQDTRCEYQQLVKGQLTLKSYRIPLAAYDSVGEIVAELESRGVIRACKSAF